MGAHTLGGALKANSGYIGVWVAGERNLFNNNFYVSLIGDGINYENQVRSNNLILYVVLLNILDSPYHI